MLEVSYIAVTSKVLKEFDLPQRALGKDLLAKDICNFLNSNTFVRLGIGGCAVGSCISLTFTYP